MAGQHPPPPPGDTYPKDIKPLERFPRGHNIIILQTLKCPIWFMHHVFITYYTLKSIYFAGITFICDAKPVVFFNKHAVLIMLAFYLRCVTLRFYFIQFGNLRLHPLYNNFLVLFFSLCFVFFSNYHMVKKEKRE